MNESNPRIVDLLLSEYSDFYKDIHGFRPALTKHRLYYTEDEARALIQSCHDYLAAVASTSLGRQQLENEGWIINSKLPSDAS